MYGVNSLKVRSRVAIEGGRYVRGFPYCVGPQQASGQQADESFAAGVGGKSRTVVMRKNRPRASKNAAVAEAMAQRSGVFHP